MMRLLRHRSHHAPLQRYLSASEQVLVVTRQHPLVLITAVKRMLSLLVPLSLVAWGLAGVEILRGPLGNLLITVVFLAMVLLVLRFAWHVLSWELERVVITNEKVVHLSGVLNRLVASTPLAKASEFTVKQTLLGRLFDYGALVVDVPGGRADALHGIAHLPDPAGMYRLVSERSRPAVEKSLPTAADRIPAPSAEDLARIEKVSELAKPRDPWQLSLDVESCDHTIPIPVVTRENS